MASTGTVVGYFASETQAETAVSALKAAGFSSSQIGVALSTTGATTSSSVAGESYAAAGTSQAAGIGHAAGEKAASAWDRFKGFFEGSDVEPYADERTTDTTHSHEITAGGYEHEDFSHSLSGLNVTPDQSRYFGHRIGSEQGAVVTVTAPVR